jgi:putative acetyltransferase
MSTIRRATAADRDRLLEVWLRAVRATHAFLNEQDVQDLLPVVRDVVLAGEALELWVLEFDPGEPAAFMGLDGAAVEALFVDPAYFRKGAGKRLLAHARALKGPLTVDVNEQNPQGLAFYLQSGFVQAGRSDRDAAGRPFPILHLRETASPR